jgi:hypothetical protein
MMARSRPQHAIMMGMGDGEDLSFYTSRTYGISRAKQPQSIDQLDEGL